MTCDENQEEISQLIDSELDAAKRPRLYSHLAACEACREFLDGTLRLRTELVRCPIEEIPSSLNARVAATQTAGLPRDQDRQGVALKGTRTRTAIPTPAVALFLVIFLLGAILFSSALTFEIRTNNEVKGAEAYFLSAKSTQIQMQ